MATAAILGGGLAGLTVAKQLKQFGFDTTVYERTSTLGGKASAFAAERRAGDPVLYEHGYHFFAGWYKNTRKLLDEIGVHGLIDFDRWHYLEPLVDGELQLRTLAIPKSGFDVGTMVKTLRDSPASIPETLLYLYFLLDTVGERMKEESKRFSPVMSAKRAVLDRISRTGMLRGRWYATPTLAELDLQNTLKASAIPSHEMSAFTVKKVQDAWFANISPFLSVLAGDLQTTFVDRYVDYLTARGVKFELEHELLGFLPMSGNRLGGVRIRTSQGERDLEADVYVIATPLEVTRRMVTEQMLERDPQLGQLHYLRAEPMAALHLRLKRKLDLPREHIIFGGNQFGLSFIDQSTLWPDFPDRDAKSYLSFISAQFVPIAHFTAEEQYDTLMTEIVKFVPITKDDVEHWEIRPNVDTPLFINTVGAWANRPSVNSAIDNLYLAGDWVKNDTDLACMEGAVCAALDCAHAICLEHRGEFLGAPVPDGSESPPRFGETKAWLLTKALAPMAFGAWAGVRASRWWSRLWEE